MKFDLYDFDGTIYDGDSGVDMVFYAIKKKPWIIFNILGSIGVVLLYILKLRTKEDMKNRLFNFLKYFPDTDELVNGFWESHEHKIKKFFKDKKSHSKDIIISASASFWLEPIALKYKVHDLIATDVDPHTGIIKNNNCHGKEKVKLFYSKYPKAKVMKMYTDSVHDLPLIEEAREGILVKKNKLYNYYEYRPNFIVRFWRWGWGIYHKNEELWNYLIVGGLTTVVSIVVKFGLLFTVLDASNPVQLQAAVIISWIAAVLFAYVTNRIYVFKSHSKEIFRELVSFCGGRVLTLLLDMLIMWFFVTLLKLDSDGWVFVWTMVSQVLVMIFNYIISKIFVFKKEK